MIHTKNLLFKIKKKTVDRTKIKQAANKMETQHKVTVGRSVLNKNISNKSNIEKVLKCKTEYLIN